MSIPRLSLCAHNSIMKSRSCKVPSLLMCAWRCSCSFQVVPDQPHLPLLINSVCPNPYTTTAQGDNIKWRRDILKVVARLPGTQILRIGADGLSYYLPPCPSTPHYLTSHTHLHHHSRSPIHHCDVSHSPIALRSWPP